MKKRAECWNCKDGENWFHFSDTLCPLGCSGMFSVGQKEGERQVGIGNLNKPLPMTLISKRECFSIPVLVTVMKTVAFYFYIDVSVRHLPRSTVDFV